MRNEEINQKISRAFENAAPDVLDTALSECGKQERKVIVLTENRRIQPWVKRLSGIAAAFILLTAVFLGVRFYHDNYKVALTVSLDVNPSIEIQVNQKERVLEVIPHNEDGVAVVGDMDFSGNDLDITVNALIGSMLRNGYLSDIANSILVSVDGTDPTKSTQLQEKLTQEINALLQTDTFSGAVLSQTISADEGLRQLADSYGITVGKAQLVQRIMELSPIYTFEDLAGLSINELNLLLRNQNDENGRVESIGTASDKAYVGTEAAKKAALEHAGLKETDVTLIKAELEWEDGVMIYEVDFWFRGWEYDYEIDARTGEVQKSEKEMDELLASSKKPGTRDDDAFSSSNAPVNGDYISEAEAQNAALNHAGASSADALFMKTELDMDDGAAVYEVEFYSAGYEYEYEIDAETGSVRKHDKEYDDDLVPATPSASAASYITEEKAKENALAHAGISSGRISEYSADFDQEDGVMVYELEFKSDGYEYNYEINALSGAVIKGEKEIDD